MKKDMVNIDNIQNRIFTIRGAQVMLDDDLAGLYQVEIRVLNQAVKRNIERFPESFRFQLTKDESEYLRSHDTTSKKGGNFLKSQNVTLNKADKRGKHRKYLPYVFTEQGVAMLSAVLRSEIAVKVSIRIMRAFVEMKKIIAANAAIFQRLEKVELKQMETDQKVERVFSALEDKSIKPEQGVFFDGQVFDAYKFLSKLIRSAKTSIVLLDNYIDETVLTHFEKRKKGVSFTILTKAISKKLKLDILKFNAQYPVVKIEKFKNAHDRFMIIDNKIIYHFGASLKDLGKKWFAFSKMDVGVFEILKKVKELV